MSPYIKLPKLEDTNKMNWDKVFPNGNKTEETQELLPNGNKKQGTTVCQHSIPTDRLCPDCIKMIKW